MDYLISSLKLESLVDNSQVFFYLLFSVVSTMKMNVAFEGTFRKIIDFLVDFFFLSFIIWIYEIKYFFCYRILHSICDYMLSGYGPVSKSSKICISKSSGLLITYRGFLLFNSN